MRQLTILRAILFIFFLPAVAIAASFDPESHSTGATFAANTISGWGNGASSIIANTSWTTGSTKYLKADNAKDFILKTLASSRDMELKTWTRSGYAILRYNVATGKGIYFLLNLEVATGQLEIGIITGAGEGSYLQGTRYMLWFSSDLNALIPAYENTPTDGHYFTFGVEGFDIYVKYNGTEFLRFQDYRCMQTGIAAVKGNANYGIRFTEDTTLSDKVLLSDYQSSSIDQRDFGLKNLVALGSIGPSSNQLVLQSNPGFAVGDYIIVEIGGETGKGLRATRGVGGTWPALSFADATARDADTSQAKSTFAWLETTGGVWQWNGSIWFERDPVNLYYSNTVYPKSLRARITAINSLTLTLSASASVATTAARVHFDNWYVLQKLIRDPTQDGEMNWPVVTVGNDLTGITPTGWTLRLPTGEFAFGAPMLWRLPQGWTFIGQGRDSTKIFSPMGVVSLEMQIDSPSVTVRNMELRGNARDNGYGLNSIETDVPAGSGYPSGFFFSQVGDNGVIEDVRVRDVFQKAVGTSFADNVWARRVSAVITEGLRQYVQWIFQWADSGGGGCEDCSVWSPRMLGGFEFFGGLGQTFIRPVGVNAIMAMNGAGNWLVEDGYIEIIPLANVGQPTFSANNPLFNVNTNIGGGNADQGGTIRNFRMLQHGYTDTSNNVLPGIVVNKDNPNVIIERGWYKSPDYDAGSSTQGALAINSTGQNLQVNGFHVLGGTINPQYGHITIFNGAVRDSIVDTIKKSGAPGDVTLSGNYTRSEWAAVEKFTPIRAGSAPLMLQGGGNLGMGVK